MATTTGQIFNQGAQASTPSRRERLKNWGSAKAKNAKQYMKDSEFWTISPRTAYNQNHKFTPGRKIAAGGLLLAAAITGGAYFGAHSSYGWNNASPIESFSEKYNGNKGYTKAQNDEQMRKSVMTNGTLGAESTVDLTKTTKNMWIRSHQENSAKYHWGLQQVPQSKPHALFASDNVATIAHDGTQELGRVVVEAVKNNGDGTFVARFYGFLPPTAPLTPGSYRLDLPGQGYMQIANQQDVIKQINTSKFTPTFATPNAPAAAQTATETIGQAASAAGSVDTNAATAAASGATSAANGAASGAAAPSTGAPTTPITANAPSATGPASWGYNVSSAPMHFATRLPYLGPSAIHFSDPSSANVKDVYTPVATMQAHSVTRIKPIYSRANLLSQDLTSVIAGGVIATPYTDASMTQNTDKVYDITLSGQQSVSVEAPDGAKAYAGARFNDAADMSKINDNKITADEAQSLDGKLVVYTIEKGDQSYLVGIRVHYATPAQVAQLPAVSTSGGVTSTQYAAKSAETDAKAAAPALENVVAPENVVGSAANKQSGDVIAPAADTSVATPVVANEVTYGNTKFTAMTPESVFGGAERPNMFAANHNYAFKRVLAGQPVQNVDWNHALSGKVIPAYK